jgi:hypothetical protein
MRAQGVIAKSRQVMVLAPSAIPRSENTAKSPSRSGGSWYLSHPRGLVPASRCRRSQLKRSNCLPAEGAAAIAEEIEPAAGSCRRQRRDGG